MDTASLQPSSENFQTVIPIQESTDTLLSSLIQKIDSVKNYLKVYTENQRYLQRVLVKSAGKLIIIHAVDIEWIEAWGDYVRMHCKGKVYLIRKKIGDVEMKFNPEQFIRVSRSAIINVNYIKELEPLNHGDYLITLIDATQLSLSRNYREHLTLLFDHHL